MTETYQTDVMSAKYIKENHVVFIEYKKHAEGDSFRTPAMHVCELARKRGATTVIADLRNADLTDTDITWLRKILIPAFEKAGITSIIRICGQDESYEPNEYRSSITFSKAKDYEDALAKIKQAEPKETMTKQKALEILGLKEDANAFAIDERFYQLTKRYRGKTDKESEDKLNELSEAYNVASGQREREQKKQEIRDNSVKIFGKTADEWKTYFSYTWLRWVIVLAVILIVGNIGYHVFIKGGYDCSIVAFGHFDFDGTHIEEALQNSGYKNPYVAAADIVVPNDEDQTQNAYSDQTLSALFLSTPDILITDNATLPYYFEQYQDLTDIYTDIKDFVGPETYSLLKPVYLSEADCAEIMAEYEASQMLDDGSYIEDPSEESIMVGFRIEDQEVIETLGITTRWKDKDQDIIIAVYSGQDDLAEAEKVLIALLNKAV